MEVIKIAIIEDNKGDIGLIKNVLNVGLKNLEIVEFNTLKEFDSTWEESDTDIIIADHKLPDGTSYDVLNVLSEKEKNIPIIILSGALQDSDIATLITEYNVNDIILKSDLHRLNQAIIKELQFAQNLKQLEVQSEELKILSLVAKHTHNGVILTNSNEKVVWVNEAYTTLTGFTFEDTVGKQPGTILQGKKTSSTAKNRMRKYLNDKVPFSEEVLNYKKSGEAYWIKLDITPIFENGIHSGYVAIQEDITDRRRTELLLESNEELFRSLTENLSGVVVRYSNGENNPGTIDYISERCLEIFGVSQKDILEDNSKLWSLVDLEDVEAMQPTIEESAKNLSAWKFQYRITTPKGERKWLRASGTPRYDKFKKETIWATLVIDITNEILAEKHLTKNEELFRSLTENLPGVVIRYSMGDDNPGTIEYISESCFEIFERSQKEILEDNLKLWSLIDPEDVKRMVPTILESAENLTLWTFQYKMTTPSGKQKWIRTSGTPRPRKENNQVIWDTIAIDITKEVEYEIALERSNERLINAQKAGKIGDWHYDLLDGSITWSEETYQVYDRDKDLGVPDYEQIVFGYTIEGAEQLHKLIELAITDTKPYELEIRIKTENGEEKDLLAIGIPSKNESGKIVALFGTVQDITTRMDAVRQIRESEIRLDSAIHGADLAVWDLEVNTGTIIVNDRWYTMIGYDPGEISPDFDPFLNLIHPDDKAIFYEASDNLNDGEDEFSIIIRLQHKDGSYRIIRDQGRVIERDENGKYSRLIGTNLDITKEMTLQEELKMSLNDKTILLQEIHHRVKNNLAVIIGLLHLQSYNTKYADVGIFYEEMSNRIKSIADVHELLYSSETLSKINLKTYIEKLFNNVLSVSNSESPPNPLIFIDDNLEMNINQAIPLGLLINELLTNSVKHAFKGVDNPTISFSVLKENDSVNIVYKDNGVGFKLDGRSSPTSLGFTLINTLLSQLESEFSFTNSIGFGLEFTFSEIDQGSHSYLKN